MPSPVYIEQKPGAKSFTPSEASVDPAVNLEPAELEAFRLVDLLGLSQEEAGERMGVSRGTVWRLLQSARKKAAQALTEGRHINIGYSENLQSS